MKITVLTLFPEVIEGYISSSIIRNARNKNLLEVEVLNIREYPQQQVDDYAYGGGVGMVMKIEPVVNVLRRHSLLDKHIIYLTPSGKTLNQSMSKSLSSSHEHLVLICGHYEGIDSRIEEYISEEISIGDYVITSGELAALVLLDSVTRLIPGVINKQSLLVESFDDNLLDFPVYTRPKEFEGHRVPDIYLNGDHAAILAFRQKERERVTKLKRPDLYKLSKIKKDNN